MGPDPKISSGQFAALGPVSGLELWSQHVREAEAGAGASLVCCHCLSALPEPWASEHAAGAVEQVSWKLGLPLAHLPLSLCAAMPVGSS